MSFLQIENSGSLKVITLSRPEALNSLNSSMIDGIAKALDEAETDPSVTAVLFKGAGGKAFCAGGDIKAAREGAIAVKSGLIRLEKVIDFFVREYDLNKRLFHYPKPTISFMNGITMGGGVGIANACRYKIATEKTIWAMPEVTIGFFPDVGAGFYLAKCPGFVGRYLGLTGAYLSNPADLIHCGLADFYVGLAEEDRLIAELSDCNNIEDCLTNFHSGTGKGELNYADIMHCFAEGSVEAILKNLDNMDSEWAKATVELILSKSPTSLKVTLQHLIKAESEEFDEIIARDLHLAGKFLAAHDMSEGIRAAVVDKDRNPQWFPKTLSEVGIETVQDYIN